MKFNIYKNIFILLMGTLAYLSFQACDEHILSEFQSKDDYTISDFDNDACFFLSRDLTTVDTIIVDTDTTYSVTNHFVPITVTYLDSINNDWINASDSLIGALYDTLIMDTTLLVSNPENGDFGYALYNHSADKSSTVYFFVSWEMNTTNSDAYISVEIVDKSGNWLKLQSNSIPLETTAGCSQTVETSSGFLATPSVRARLQFSLQEGSYLVRFYVSEASSIGNFRVAIL